MNYPDNYYFTKEHEWVYYDGEIAAVGLTELAYKEMSGIKKIEINSLGKH
ncbi:MAG: hypothetical protein ACK4ND_05865 [Cytophagaceae bacterium]